jgi:uncharacterized phage-like protein YoqJ
MIICGTGHRPDKLGGYSPEVFGKLERTAYSWLHSHMPDTVISGGALGWDQALAAAAMNHGIDYVLALPFPGFEDRWPTASKTFLHSLMYRASKVEFVSQGPYAGYKMQVRNEWMVDHADKVLALWDGSTGGTFNCVSYAKKKNKPIINLWEEWNK